MSHQHVSSSHRPLGAVPVKNEKGAMTMQKVKVQRYITGRRPEYANERSAETSEEEESDNEIDIRSRQPLPGITTHRGQLAFALPRKGGKDGKDSDEEKEEEEEEEEEDSDDDVRMQARRNRETVKVDPKKLDSDPRMRRIMQTHRQLDSDDEEDLPRRSRGEASHARRPVEKPQILNTTSQDSDDGGSEDEDGDVIRKRRREREVIDAEAIDDDEVAEEESIERRHELIKQRIAQLEIAQQQHQQSAADDDEEDEDEAEEDEEESEFEEFSDSEDEGMPRLKPIFVSKKDRITIIEKEQEEERRLAAAEAEKKLVAEQRRRATMKLVEEERRREEEEDEQRRAAAEEEAIIKGIAALLTDDEDEETGFELWKVRELKRIKREKEEEEARDKERAEIERLRNMTEEERQAELEANPRQITNKVEKGKYKFMQKYYHRGVFYLDEEAAVLKRDTAQPTLEDHFDKTVMPSVMQVKNFGRAGRTKYTHLVDQDTTAFDHAWGDKKNTGAIKYHSTHGGGMKQVFERPGKRKKPGL